MQTSSCCFWCSNSEPDNIMKRLQHTSGQSPDLVLLMRIKIRRILAISERNVADLGLRWIQQGFDRHLEDFDDLSFLHDVVDRLVNDAHDRRDEESAVRDDVFER